ncbi:hypothetical protein TcWFU_006512 [Taenia crassiceps]|uniref:Uncharacterized protein n=1 Tax=Taenia crassiceps TaxID=6207 RepID=A0ABR4QRQ1_9CEST
MNSTLSRRIILQGSLVEAILSAFLSPQKSGAECKTSVMDWRRCPPLPRSPLHLAADLLQCGSSPSSVSTSELQRLTLALLQHLNEVWYAVAGSPIQNWWKMLDSVDG